MGEICFTMFGRRGGKASTSSFASVVGDCREKLSVLVNLQWLLLVVRVFLFILLPASSSFRWGRQADFEPFSASLSRLIPVLLLLLPLLLPVALLLPHDLLLLLQLPFLLLPAVLEPDLDLLLRDLGEERELPLALAVYVLVAAEVGLQLRDLKKVKKPL